MNCLHSSEVLSPDEAVGRHPQSRQAGGVSDIACTNWCERCLPDDIGLIESSEEDGLEVHPSFEANALAKAWWFARKSGLVSLADDSGVEVDALGGAPGVHSKRFAGFNGPDHEVAGANTRAIVKALRESGTSDWRARYRCVLVLARPAGAEWLYATPRSAEAIVVSGTTEGRIIAEARGIGGFGYDPHFLSVELGKTFGEASAEEKHSVSHRGRAVGALIAGLTR